MSFVLPAAKAAQLALGIKKAAEKISVSSTGYNFVQLLQTLVIFFIISYVVAKYFEAVIFGQNFMFQLLKLIGVHTPPSIPEPVRLFFTEGYAGIKFWDIIQAIGVLMIIYEAYQYFEQTKEEGKRPNATVAGTFAILIIGFALVTFPALMQRLKEMQIIKQGV